MAEDQSYIESRLPLEEISIESQRERGASSALPPLYFLHVWWARRPLTASKAAVLGALLPAEVSDEHFKNLLGIRGDPVAAQKAILEAAKTNTRIKDPFGYGRAFTHNLTVERMDELKSLYKKHLGTDSPIVLDPMAGGGSIPLEALRVGANVIAAEYNPVAYVILKATLEYPAKFGRGLAEEIRKWGQWINSRARESLNQFYPKDEDEHVLAFIWARTIRCPSCNLIIPLSPNWWLSRQKGKKERIAARPKVAHQGHGDNVTFEIIDVAKHLYFDPNKGTVTKGKASCLRCKNTIRDDYIKKEAQQRRMGHQLYAIFMKRKIGPKKWKKNFRLPTTEDLKAYEKAVHLVERGVFQGSELVPIESVPEGLNTRQILNYGVTTWNKFFNARQLLTHASYLYYILEAKKKIFDECGVKNRDRAVAITLYLTTIFDKCLDYNSLLTRWENTRNIVKNTFDRHDFAPSWSYGEMPIPDLGFEWAIDQITDSYEGLCSLLEGVDALKVRVCLGSSMNLSYVNGLVDAVIVDPPYYANVMYGELSDFFYVWMKRILGDLYCEFEPPLTDKDEEIVANPARFKDLGVNADAKAREDYRRKMTRTFREIRRILKPDGVLTVMFTHKATEAWDTLATALIETGFQIKRSWPIRTESEHSLQIAKKNAVKSTIFLVARKREGEARRGWWEQEIYPEIERVAEEKAAEFEARGMQGVDLYISTFGPVLEVFSKFSEVKSMTGDIISPEKALDVARKVVTERTFQSLVPSGATGIDEATRFYVLAMKFYRARQFPFDEARKLAISVGVDIDELRDKEHIVKKKSEDIIVLNASEREHGGYIDLAKPSDRPLINAIHLVELAFQHGGLKAYQRLASQIRLDVNPDYQVALKALHESLPEADPEKRALASLLLTPVESRVKGSRIDEYS